MSTKEERDRIAQEQCLLKAMGYDLGAFGEKGDGVDGIRGKQTRAAEKAARERLGLPADGDLLGALQVHFMPHHHDKPQSNDAPLPVLITNRIGTFVQEDVPFTAGIFGAFAADMWRGTKEIFATMSRHASDGFDKADASIKRSESRRAHPEEPKPLPTPSSPRPLQYADRTRD